MTPAPRATWTQLRVLREKDGHSLSSLAAVTVNADGKPMSLGYLSDLENGKRRPSAAVIKRLARALNVPMSMLEPRRDLDVAS